MKQEERQIEKGISADLFESGDTPANPPEGLFSRIITAIERKKRSRVRRRFAALGGSFLASASFLVVALKSLTDELTQAGTWQIFSLLFSDLKIILENWQEFVWSILESLPALSMTLFLVGVFAALLSVKFILESLGRNNLKRISSI